MLLNLKQTRHVIPQHLQSCTLIHKMHLISSHLQGKPHAECKTACSSNATAPAQFFCKVMASSSKQKQWPHCCVRYQQPQDCVCLGKWLNPPTGCAQTRLDCRRQVGADMQLLPYMV